jgi:hypothetical protein
MGYMEHRVRLSETIHIQWYGASVGISIRGNTQRIGKNFTVARPTWERDIERTAASLLFDRRNQAMTYGVEN